jgi:hypothetical protein
VTGLDVDDIRKIVSWHIGVCLPVPTD